MAARTRFFDQQVLEAIERGVRQIVILGAGYDGRALRFADPDVAFYEVDRGATLSDKRRRLDQLGIDESASHFVACDLRRDDLAAALRTAGLESNRPLLVLCEGLLPYLPPEDAEQMLRAMASIASPSSTLAVNVLVRPPAHSVKEPRPQQVVGLPAARSRRATTGLTHGLLIQASPAPSST